MSSFFIRRPIVAMVIAIITVLIGAVSLFGLPIAQFPQILPPQINLTTTYTGADALTIEQSIATPIEQQMNGVDRSLYIQSTNANDGTMNQVVTFDVGTDLDVDNVLVNNRYSQAQPFLPNDVKNFGVTIKKSLAFPLMVVSLYSPDGRYDPTFLSNYALININDALLRVKGVGDIRNLGASDYSMRIWLNPDLLSRLGLTVTDVQNALRQQNVVNPAGQVGAEPAPAGQQLTYTVRAQGRLVEPSEFGNVIVRENPDGSSVRVKDVARIEMGALNYQQYGTFNGQPAAVIAAFQTPGSNALDVAESIRKTMNDLATRFPSGIKYEVSLDTTAPVKAGIREIVETLLEAIALVVLVVFVFLQSWRATLIPLLTVPLSLVGAFALFPLLGFSVNTLSLFGLVLAIGLVVDDAIVVVEAVEHHIEGGMTPHDAAQLAMEEVSGPVVAIALSVLFSAFNALSLSPALSAMLLRPKKEARGPLGAFFRGFNKGFGHVTDGYVGVCRHLIHKAGFAFILLGILCVGAAFFGSKVPGSFLPDEDQGYVFGGLQLPDASSLQRTSEAARQVEDIMMQTPGVQSVSSIIGYSLLSGVQTTYSAFFFVSFKPWDVRKTPETSYDGIKLHLARALSQVNSGIAFAFPPPAILGVGTSGGFTFILEDRSGSGTDFLAKNTQAFMEAARKRPELTGVMTTSLFGVPQVGVDVDKAKILTQQISLSNVYQTLQAFMGGALVNYYNQFGLQWQVWVQADGKFRTNVDNLGKFYVKNATGEMVPLSTLTSTYSRSGTEFVMRQNLYQCVQINGSAAPGYSSGQAMAALEEVFKQTMPSQMGYDWSGMSYQQEKAAQGVSPTTIFSLSFLVVFLIMAAQYESWTLPFSVLLGVPIAVFGAFVALFFRHLDNDVYAQIGLVMLIGLSAKNAILIVEFAKMEYDKGATLLEASLTGAKLRLRPILMTAFAFILGCVPLWVATGAGGISRQVLGSVVIGGMLAATLLAVFFIPVSFDV